MIYKWKSNQPPDDVGFPKLCDMYYKKGKSRLDRIILKMLKKGNTKLNLKYNNTYYE